MITVEKTVRLVPLHPLFPIDPANLAVVLGPGYADYLADLAAEYGLDGEPRAVIALALVAQAKTLGLGDEYDELAATVGQDGSGIAGADLRPSVLRSRLRRLFMAAGLTPVPAVSVAVDALAISAGFPLWPTPPELEPASASPWLR